MSWLTKLYETYEQAKIRYDDLPIDQQVMPISHTLQNAHVHVVINNKGEFLRAQVLEKTQVVLPATEQSAGRSSGLCAHALADKIQYVAGDYAAFGGIKKPGYDLYLTQLRNWVASDFKHSAVQAILSYVEKGQLVKDLIAAKIMFAHDNQLLTQWQDDGEAPALFKVLPKEKGQLDQGSALVCWSVETKGIAQSKTWLDETIQQSWIDYESQNGGEKTLCFVTGNEQVVATNHPAKIRHSGDKAKLISANDTSGFTFRGKFLTVNDAANVSFEVTQKAHNALRWLLAKQGYRTGEQVYLAWAVSGKETPIPTELDLMSLFANSEEVDHQKNLGESYAEQLNRYFSGMVGHNDLEANEKLEANEQIALLGLDSATPGRMGIIYYRETIAQEFIDQLHKWQLDLGWWQRVKKNEKATWLPCAPSLYKVLDGVYGDVLKSSETLKKNLVARLYPCIVEGQPIPIDIVNNAFQRATNRVAYKSDQTWLWLQNLGIACALYKGYCKRTANLTHKKDYNMALQETYASRDYLFGRLLATANKIEQVALSIGEGNRLTTAERYMNRFVSKPAATWLTISTALQPYQQRLHSRLSGYDSATKKLVTSITDMFEIDEFTSDKKLSPEFLLGFHSQMLWLEKHKVVEGQWVNKTDSALIVEEQPTQVL